MRPERGSLPRFLLVWAGQLLSRLGSGITAFALGVYLYRQTGSVAVYSFLLLVAFLPSVVLSPVGGVIADRRERLRLMILGDLGGAAGILLVMLALLFGTGSGAAVYIGVGITSLFGALHAPAFKASVTDLLDEADYSRASGMVQLAEASRYLLAPVIAAFLMAHMALWSIMAVDMASFLAGAVAVAVVRRRATARGRATVHRPAAPKAPAAPGAANGDGKLRALLLRDLAGGFAYLRARRDLQRLLLLTTAVTFFTGLLQSLFGPLVLSIASAQVFGSVQSIAATGMLASCVVIGAGRAGRNQRRVLGVSLFVLGAAFLGIGLGPNVVLITISAFGLFLALPFVNTSLEVLFRTGVTDKVQGRVWSLISLVSQTGMLIAFGVAGILADRVFEPLLSDNSPGRGIAVMIALSGLIVMMLSRVRITAVMPGSPRVEHAA